MSLSPPPLKRQRVQEECSEDAASYDLSIYSWNVNGIDALLQPSITHFFGPNKQDRRSAMPDKKELSPLQVVLARHHWPELYFLQEVKIRPADDACMRAVRKAVAVSDQKNVPAYEAHFCLPRRRRASAAKVYGVCTLIRKDFADESVDRVESVDWDNEGRFLLTYTRKTAHCPRLAVFNAYMVNGTSLPYHHQLTGELLGTRHHRKLEVHTLLQKHCRDLEAQGYAVIIAGDINVARSELDGFPNLRTFPAQHVLNRTDFEQRFLSPVSDDRGPDGSSLCMVDSYRSLHRTSRGYSYYSRNVPFGKSCDRVDMILVSASLQDACAAAGMHETELDRGPSDHVPIYAKFNFTNHGLD